MGDKVYKLLDCSPLAEEEARPGDEGLSIDGLWKPIHSVTKASG